MAVTSVKVAALKTPSLWLVTAMPRVAVVAMVTVWAVPIWVQVMPSDE